MIEYEKLPALTIRSIPKEVHDKLAIDRVHTGKSMQALVSGLLVARYSPELNVSEIQVVKLSDTLLAAVKGYATMVGASIATQIVRDLEEMYEGGRS